MKVNVSVVMSVYNSEKYLRQAIESILNQTYKDFEFIIVNDCSQDSSFEIIREYANKDLRIKIINNSINLGLCKSCNLAISQSEGYYIIRMDSDDIANIYRIEKQVNFLNNNPEVVVVGSNADIIDMNGEFVYKSSLPNSDLKIKNSLKHRPTFIHPTVCFRKKYFEAIGGYYEPIKHYFEDFILWTQLAKFGKYAIIEESLLEYRITMNSISTVQVSKQYKELEIEIAQRGFASEEELEFIKKEKSVKAEPRNAELAYYLILAQRYLIDNYNLDKALKNIELASNLNIKSTKLLQLKILSYLPKIVIKNLYLWIKKE